MDPAFALTAADIDRYIPLRRMMLETEPLAFGSHPDVDGGLRAEVLRERLGSASSATFATADAGGALTATAGVFRDLNPKTVHRASIVAVFTRPDCRGRGLGRACVVAAMDHARSWGETEVINLSVSPTAPAAMRLYESLGFRAWGREPNALRVDGVCHEEIHMQLVVR